MAMATGQCTQECANLKLITTHHFEPEQVCPTSAVCFDNVVISTCTGSADEFLEGAP